MTKKLVTVHNVRIVDGSPVLTPVTFEFETDNYVAADNAAQLYPSDELQQESARLNQMFNNGYF